MKKYYLAIDLGASSGRHIVGWKEDEEINTKEVYRFTNTMKKSEEKLIWDIHELLKEVKTGIQKAFEEFSTIESLSIDTWGVDYVLMQEDKEILPCYAYRDSRTQKAIPLVHQKIPFEELYEKTGCQFQSFNTIYQLYDDLLEKRLDNATDFLMIPEYLMYKLTGVKTKEYTNATTTGMIDKMSGEFDSSILETLSLPQRLFSKLSHPRTVLGSLLPEVAKEVKGNCKVVLCATHDTASAVEAIPMKDQQLYISSGTWSLLGVKTDRPIVHDRSRCSNYSNEGGIGYNRYQKNIMGLWIVQQLKKELCPWKDFDAIVEEARASNFDEMVDVNASDFLSPASMKTVFDTMLTKKPETLGDYFRCAYRSLAKSYHEAIKELEENTCQEYSELYIVGGGAKNTFLNELSEQFTGKKVIALPIEASAVGNLKIQMEVQNDI